MNPFAWLLDTTPFRVPQAVGIWSNELIAINIFSFMVTALGFQFYACMLYGCIQWTRRGRGERLPWPRLWLAGALFWAGVSYWLRALAFLWPGYRMQVAVNFVVALHVWVLFGFAGPLVGRRFER